MDCSPPGPSVHGILQARIPGWVSISSPKRSSPPRGRAHVSCSPARAGRFFSTEPLGSPPGLETRPNASFASCHTAKTDRGWRGGLLGKKRGAVRATARRRGGSEVSAVFGALRAEGLGCILLLLRNLLFGESHSSLSFSYFICKPGR